MAGYWGVLQDHPNSEQALYGDTRHDNIGQGRRAWIENGQAFGEDFNPLQMTGTRLDQGVTQNYDLYQDPTKSSPYANPAGWRDPKYGYGGSDLPDLANIKDWSTYKLPNGQPLNEYLNNLAMQTNVKTGSLLGGLASDIGPFALSTIGAGLAMGGGLAGLGASSGGFAADSPYWSMFAGDAPAGGISGLGSAAAGAGGPGAAGAMSELFAANPAWGEALASGSLAGLSQADLSSLLNATKTLPGMAELGAPSGGGSALSRLLSGDGGAQDYASLLSSLGTLGTSIGGADAFRSANNTAADKMLAIGEPYRQLLNTSYNDPNFMQNHDAGYTGAIDNVMNSYLRKASTGGNPFMNPGVSMEANKYVTASTALPQLNADRSNLVSAGSMGIANANQPNINAARSAIFPYTAETTGLGGLSSNTQPFDYQSFINQIMGGQRNTTSPGYLGSQANKDAVNFNMDWFA